MTDKSDLRAQRELLIAFGIIKPPKPKTEKSEAKKKHKNALELGPHYPVGYPCQRCGRTNNILHVGTIDDEEQADPTVDLANEKSMAWLKEKGFLEDTP